MTNPVLVQLMRGRVIESIHRGAFVISDASGKIIYSLGDIDRPIFPRSAIKIIQALFLVESGAAQAYGLSHAELALACASHSSEPDHVKYVQKMLERAGLTPDDLACGSHWSIDHKVLIEQARAGLQPASLHNNCSGKHAGFLCAARYSGMELKGYVAREHEVQREVANHIKAITAAKTSGELCGIDGCAIPTYAIPLRNIALGFAKMATGENLSKTRAYAAKRLIHACMAEPFYVAGSNRACTRMMEMAAGKIFVKTGAEGVYTAILPEHGWGIALKIDDGATRAAEVMIAMILARIFGSDNSAGETLYQFATRQIKNWNGQIIGAFRPLSEFDI